MSAKHISIFLVLLFFTKHIWSQEFVKVTGHVMGQESNVPLPYASIVIKGQSLGTTANDLGEFELSMPIRFLNDSLFISFIGYKTFKERISNLSHISQFYLRESPIILTEVVVSSDGAKKLIQEALKAVPDIYPTSPYLMTGFHRSWEKVDFTDSVTYPGTLIEAAVTIYDPGYTNKRKSTHNIPSNESVYINEVRKSALKKGWDYEGNHLRHLLRENVIKYNREHVQIFLRSFLDFPNSFVYEWDGTTKMENETVNIIKVFITNPGKFPAFYKVYVSDLDHAILRFELSGIKREINFSKDWHMDSLNQIYIFKKYNNKTYLSYAKMNYVIKKIDVIKKKVLRTEVYFKELLLTEINVEDVEQKRKALGKESGKNSFAMQAKSYNSEFWKNYNIIKENPLDKEIIRLFEQTEKLSSQFKKSGEGKQPKR